MPTPDKLTILISGPSGCGKTVLIKSLIADPGLGFAVSATTRPPRPHEVDGVDYHFVTEEQFSRLVVLNAFLEWAMFSGNSYGTPRTEIQRIHAGGKDAILDLDSVGGMFLIDSLPDIVSIFLLPPSRERLIERLKTRGTDPETLAQRLTTVAPQCLWFPKYKYLIVNDDLTDTFAQLRSIIQAERLRTRYQSPQAHEILETFR